MCKVSEIHTRGSFELNGRRDTYKWAHWAESETGEIIVEDRMDYENCLLYPQSTVDTAGP